MLALSVLGPVAVSDDGVELRLRGTRQRALLAALAVDAGRVVPAEVLMERIWGERLPAGPGNALQQQVLKLRRIVGEDAVAFDPPGYRLAVAADAVDSRRFERLVERARRCPPDAPDAAEALLSEALALWRGPPLADCVYWDWAAGEAARLDELRLEAEELRLDALLRAGRQAEAIGPLERLVHEEPLRERLRALLMLALYRDGRQAEALAAYGAARATLVEELGVEPGPELRSLHERILRQDPSLTGRGAARAPSAGQIPAALARQLRGGRFVGRGSELEQLEAAWTRACAGEVTSVFVVGEPGAGKTRLAAEHARAVAQRGARVLYGRGDEEVAVPYGPLASALGQLVEAASPDVLDAHVRVHGGELARLVPGLAARVDQLPAPLSADPDTERFRLRSAVIALVDAAAERAPIMLVLDDIHWADRATLALLLQLLRGPDARLLVVATLRDTEADQLAPLRALLGDLLREPGSRRLGLPALTEHDVLALVEAALGRTASAAEAALGRAVHRETEGNALFATELLRHIADSGGLGRAPEQAAALDVPPTVRALVVQRLERTGGATAAALLPATVIGPSFETDMLARVTGIPEEELIDALDRARAAALVVEARDEPGRFFFAHAVIRAALADTLGPARRRRLHGRVAAELEALGVTDARRLGELARHWTEAGDEERGRAAAVRAGDAALALLAPDEAARWYRRAIELLGAGAGAADGERAELLVRLGEAERRAGSDAFREHLLEAGRLARDLGDADRLARAALANNRGMHSRTGAVDQERIELLEAALELRGDGDDGRHALLLATTSSELWSGDHDRRRALSDEALAVARRAGDARVLAEVIYRRAFAIAEPATLAERLELTAELVALTDRLGDPLLRVLASTERSRAAIESGDRAEALLHAERQVARAAGCGDAYGRHAAGWARGWPLVLAGRYEEASRAAEAALAESLQSGQPDALAFYGAQLAVILWDQGRLGDLADAILKQALGPEGLPAHRALAALALVEGGRAGEAGELIDEAAATGFDLPVDTIWLTGTVIWGEVCALSERRDAAPVLFERLLPWRDQVAFTGLAVHGSAARIAAELAALLERDDAGELFALAAAVHERLEAPALLARTRAGWARWLWRSGAEARAREQLERARAAAAACGCPGLLSRAAAIR